MNTDIKALKQHMHSSIVSFEYLKKDGSIREARGTTNIEIINEILGIDSTSIENTSDKPKRNISEDNTRYFDVDKKGWRSFTNDRFRSFTIDD